MREGSFAVSTALLFCAFVRVSPAAMRARFSALFSSTACAQSSMMSSAVSMIIPRFFSTNLASWTYERKKRAERTKNTDNDIVALSNVAPPLETMNEHTGVALLEFHSFLAGGLPLRRRMFDLLRCGSRRSSFYVHAFMLR